MTLSTHIQFPWLLYFGPLSMTFPWVSMTTFFPGFSMTVGKLLDRVYPKSQYGFRPGDSTIGMLSSHQLQEKCREQTQPLYVAFIDLTNAALNLASWASPFMILGKIGCAPKLLRIPQQVIPWWYERSFTVWWIIIRGIQHLLYSQARMCSCSCSIWRLLCSHAEACLWTLS